MPLAMPSLGLKPHTWLRKNPQVTIAFLVSLKPHTWLRKQRVLQRCKSKTLIEDICFELSVKDTHAKFDYSNSAKIESFIRRCEDDYQDELEQSDDAQKLIAQLKSELSKYKAQAHRLEKEDLKSVYLILKNRQLHLNCDFDRMGRFYLTDSELVDARSPSVKYPYSQMNAGRTSKFVKAIADKYACKTREELMARFDRA